MSRTQATEATDQVHELNADELNLVCGGGMTSLGNGNVINSLAVYIPSDPCRNIPTDPCRVG